MKKNLSANYIRKKQLLIFGAAFLVILIIFSLSIYAYSYLSKINRDEIGDLSIIVPDISPDNKEQKQLCADCLRRALDGVYVERGEENIYPVAVMINNHVEARPQAGLAKANLVYEAEVEGGTTRFLAVFANKENIEKIGPVRSARPYFIDWANEFSALYVHCGGSDEALTKIRNSRTFDFNEYSRGSYFWRDKNRYAPHNLYTSSKNLNDYLQLKKVSEGNFSSWQFKDDESADQRPEAASVKVYFRKDDFVAEWKYDKEKNSYARYEGGSLYNDESGEGVFAKNVLVQYVNSKVIDDYGRLSMNNIGSGKALICLDGKCSEGKWEKKNSSSRTFFYDLEGNDLKFNAGPTWIEVVKPSYKVIFE